MKRTLLRSEFCIVFTGGGTGGHIYPGLAVADELRRICRETDTECRIVWIGSSRGMDRKIVESSGSADRFYGVPSGKLRRYFSLQNVADVFKIGAGCIASFFLLLNVKPRAVFSKGGFVSVPPCFAAKLLHIPVYTHECDFSPGLATKLNSKAASRILLSYRETARFFAPSYAAKITVTGNPVRPVFYSASAENGRRFLGLPEVGGAVKPVLLVIGGSSGARQLNELVRQNLPFLCSTFTVVHQTGANQVAPESAESSASYGDSYKPYPFIYAEMPDVLAAADIVLSRAGANSIWECAVLAKPMVLVPLSGAGTRGDQIENARFFEQAGAAVVLYEDAADAAHMRAALEQFTDAAVRDRYSRAAAALAGTARPAQVIADLVYSEVRGK
ncbi:undecaprenyldiphospho-muramoylpentapeptide beta-N-acetylglucosaminyltransferase [Treponema brennaborense]|uniref:UDP-N-acetylglucosamine--N-acetylmuramyl-(pentapeptide) pyrophosphoryl-undecaprenol N-acetylglucosamine transferase n=1 Tax=Treponema brennaborense (strain DSM 12168 / CIP 105900 / DD5/3) TaxID=906968 RepID=F4LKY2_TREBD|nr:undecaprenyldiphospho-muramoylpentapeptide beta-N-acetylglucosaminyltransferase [Treponema brennaborense]AEE16579.1 UDP-N-acetylglucosamine--N-acetylmuramyl- (pentapeptide) pyrophosphoryl-undecaprenol N-acetylglucosamine transferase [Treponema brennaborense DSM 12168]